MARLLSIVLLILLGIGLSACDNGNDSSRARTVDERLGQYQASLWVEADWLWDNMIYTRTAARPDAERCTARTFTHEAVIMDETARASDVTAGKLADYLVYAATLIQQAHAQWEVFCQGNLSPVNAVAYLESRLRPAYDTLNVVESTLIQRGAPTPTPYRVPE